MNMAKMAISAYNKTGSPLGTKVLQILLSDLTSVILYTDLLLNCSNVIALTC